MNNSINFDVDKGIPFDVVVAVQQVASTIYQQGMQMSQYQANPQQAQAMSQAGENNNG